MTWTLDKLGPRYAEQARKQLEQEGKGKTAQKKLKGRREALSERDFQQQVIDYAKVRGWKIYHPFDSRRSTPGFPDLVLVRTKPARLIFAELKTEKGRLSAEQSAWIVALCAVAAKTESVEMHLWRPSDFDEILEVLA